MNFSDIQIDGEGVSLCGRRIELPFPVEKVFLHGGLAILMLEPPAGVVFNRNVMAFTESGNLAWQIEESPHGTETDKPYVGISIDGGALIASNWNGVDYQVNVETGAVSVRAFKK